MLCGHEEFVNKTFDIDTHVQVGTQQRKQRFRRSVATKSVVCKHWLRGLCKKDTECEFLHIYDMQRMPICHFFSTYGVCNNPECLFLHLDKDTQVQDCPWYARGFCKHGKDCKKKHTRIQTCKNYLLGFCPDGPNCQYGHPKYELPLGPDSTAWSLSKLIPGRGRPNSISNASTERMQRRNAPLTPAAFNFTMTDTGNQDTEGQIYVKPGTIPGWVRSENQSGCPPGKVRVESTTLLLRGNQITPQSYRSLREAISPHVNILSVLARPAHAYVKCTSREDALRGMERLPNLTFDGAPFEVVWGPGLGTDKSSFHDKTGTGYVDAAFVDAVQAQMPLPGVPATEAAKIAATHNHLAIIG